MKIKSRYDLNIIPLEYTLIIEATLRGYIVKVSAFYLVYLTLKLREDAKGM